MQTTEITDFALKASTRKERPIAKVYSITNVDVQWIKGLAMCLGVSDSQILRGLLARARELESSSLINERRRSRFHLPTGCG